MMLDRMRRIPEQFSRFESQLHTLLGMYCWVMRLPEDAERQFQAALRTTQDTELWTVDNLSLAIVYLLTCKESDFYGLFERITPSTLQSRSTPLKASAHFVYSLHSFLHSRLQEAKSHITDSVTIVRDEGIPRIQALATLLTAKLFPEGAPDMLVAGNNWAIKSCDQLLLMWANHLIYDLHSSYGNVEQAQLVRAKLDQSHACLSQSMEAALKSPSHALIQWEGGAETFQC
ncbi:hypothetical protein AB6A40_006589 [Gnathostoma spinigerum]|uniref:Cohesin loading complex subunit SCC4 homolog n=1 Tax=Gnathostoma spinigerum TaxID=75299 RepID=A0ABD6EIS7_9BILA